MNKVLNGYKLIIYYLGVFMILIGCILLLPLIMILFYPNEIIYAQNFIIPSVISILIGYLITYFLNCKNKSNLVMYQDAILVVSVWIMAILISTIPFILTKEYNFFQAVFEVTSGYSTTGLSVVDVSSCPKIFLFYRSILLFIGGVGFVLILTSAMSDRYSLRLYNLEGHTDKLLPNLVSSARVIFLIYSIYILLGSIAYIICGMSVFDAINHSIAAISTGGFSTRVLGIYEYNSLPIEIITICLMLLGSTNFLIHLKLLRFKFKSLFLHSETILFILLFLIIIPILSLMVYNSNNNIPTSIRTSIFMFVSCITTTGFQNVESINNLPFAMVAIMILLMLIGGGSGSTAGGIKQMRIVIILKGIYYSIRDRMSNKRVIKTNYIYRIGQKDILHNDEISASQSFVLLYLVIFFIGSIIISSFGYSFTDAMFEFASSISTVGLSVGITGYNAHPVILLTCSIGMLLGRLELYVIFQAIIRIYSDIRRREVI